MEKKGKHISMLLSYVLILCLVVGLFPAATFAKTTTQMTEAKKPTKKEVIMTEVEKPQSKKTMQVTDVETQKTYEVEIEQPKKDQITETTTQTTTVNNVNNNITLTEDINTNCSGDHTGWKGLSIPTTYLESGKYYLENDLRINITIPANKTVVLCLNGHKIIGVNGSGVTVNGNFTLCDCKENTENKGQITGGNANRGGGVFVNNGATFTMNGGVITGNTAKDGGGGVYSYGTFTMRNNSEISNNTSDDYGGGVYIDGFSTFNMYNGTITGNKAPNSFGGGVYVVVNSKFNMYNGTISKNEAKTSGGGVRIASGSIFNMENGTISENKILNKFGDGGGGVAVVSSTFYMNGGRIENNTSLSSGGGVTVTDANTIFTMTGGTISNNKNTADGKSQKDDGGGGVYVGTDSTFTMLNGKISHNSTSAYSGGGVFINEGTFTMADGEISYNTNTYYNGGGVGINRSSKGGTFTMTGGSINHNSAINSDGRGTIGGGVYVGGGGTFIMEDGEISYNESSMSSAGVMLTGTLGEKPTFTMNGGKIHHNKATNQGYGAGVHVVSATFTMTGGEISKNESTGKLSVSGGGGVYIGPKGTFDMQNGKITGNTAANNGGGVLLESIDAKFTMTGGEITGNTAANNGGGVYLDTNSGTFEMSGDALITDNTKTDGQQNNVYLPIDKIVSVIGSLENAKIGVTVADPPQGEQKRKIAEPDKSGDEEKFFSDDSKDSKYKTIFENGAVYLAVRSNDEKIVTFDYQCNDIENEEVSVDLGNTVAKPTDPTRYGFTFGGWYTDEACTARNEWDFGTPVIQDLTLYAKWTENKYTVIFDYQYQNHKVTYNDVEHDSTISEPVNSDFFYPNHDFGGWYKDKNCTDGNEWFFNVDHVTGDMTLYAKWTENASTKYSVTFDYQYMGWKFVDPNIEYGHTVTPPISDFNYPDHTFKGWYKEAECINAWDFATDTVTEDTTLYAKWVENETPTPQPEQFTVEFDSRGGSTVVNQTIEKNGKVTKPADPTRDGHTFGGWYKDAECNNAWNFATDTVTEDTTLYAKWVENETPTPQPEQFTVEFNSNGGSAVASQTVTKNGTVTEPAAPTKEGYTFEGWYTDEACTARNKWDFGTLVVQNLTLYAKWVENETPTPTPEQFTVTFDSNGGSEVPSQAIESGKMATMPENPTKNDCEFLGWFADKDFNEIYRFSIPVTKDITLYAKWAEKKTEEPSKPGEIITPVQPSRPRPITPTPTNYTVTFDTNGGSEIASQTVESGKMATMPEDPTRNGYTFLGWFMDRDFNEVYRFSTPVTENITIYAKWKEKSHSSSSSGGGGGSSSSKKSTGRTGTWVTEEPKTIQPVVQYQVTNPDCPRDETCPLSKFVDVNKWAWYHDGSHYCVEHDLIIGTSNITFSPDMPITRGMVVAILWRMEDKPIVNDVLSFQDVKETAYYAEAVRWAAHNGIVSGYSSTKFGPNDAITREQMASILYRYTRYKNKEVSGRADIAKYEDKNDISNYAITAMQWACDAGIIQGISTTLLSPKGTTTRAQAAQMFYMYLKK